MRANNRAYLRGCGLYPGPAETRQLLTRESERKEIFREWHTFLPLWEGNALFAMEANNSDEPVIFRLIGTGEQNG